MHASRIARRALRAGFAGAAAAALVACTGGGVGLYLLIGGGGGHHHPNTTSGGPNGPGGPGGDVVVATDLLTDGKVEVFGTTLDGAEPTDLSGSIVPGGTTKRIAVSPNGARVAFIAAKDDPAIDELWIADLQTAADPVKLQPDLKAGQSVRDVQWSPDSSRVAYVVDLADCGGPRLFTSLASGGGSVRVLSDSAGTVVFPLSDEFDGTTAAFLWSPDSRYLACATADPESGAFDLFVATPDGARATLVAPTTSTSAGLPMARTFQRPYLPFAWSTNPALPDHVAFLVEVESDDGKGNGHGHGGDDDGDDDDDGDENGQHHHDPVKGTALYVANFDGSDSRRLSHSFDPGDSTPDDVRFAWAPNGSRIVYVTDGIVADRFELWSTDPRTTDPDADSFQVSKNTDSSLFDVAWFERDAFEWAPDSSRVAFRGDLDTAGILELFTADPRATGRVNDKINPTLDRDGQAVAAFRWSPDSRKLAYISDENDVKTYELFCTSPTGSNHTVVSRIPLHNDSNVLFAVNGEDPAYTAFDEPIQWSPDSLRIAYLADQEVDDVFEAYVSLSDGSSNFRICKDLAPMNGDVCRVTWFDSSLLLYAADEREPGRFELMSALTNGPTGTILTGADHRGGTTCPEYEAR